MATLIEEVVEMWDKNYYHKLGGMETYLRRKTEKTIDKGRKIIPSPNGYHLYSKILLNEVPVTKVYYYFDLDQKNEEFYIRLRFKYSCFSSTDKSKFKGIEENGHIPLKFVGKQQLELGKNLFNEKPEFICNCMEKFIRLTQKPIYEFYKQQCKSDKPKKLNMREDKLREDFIKYAKTLFPEYEIKRKEYGIETGKRIDLLLENKKNKSWLVIEFKAGEAGYEALGQISTYLSILKCECPDKEIKGSIIAKSFKDGFEYATLTNENITLYEYQNDGQEFELIPTGEVLHK
ncbi:hypothetical protein R83H12_01743 [Fibrobacteria bacterium R8-3-H12]